MSRDRRRGRSRIPMTLPDNTPDALRGPPAKLIPIPPPPGMVELTRMSGYPFLRAYLLGETSVIVTREYDRWHLSVAHPTRLPTWPEVSSARYRIVPDNITMAMLLPPKAQYVNIHEFCLQMVEIEYPEGPA